MSTQQIIESWENGVEPYNATTQKQFITQRELDTLNPHYFDLRTIAVCEGSTWHFLGTNVWYKTSGKN